jgi:hypothetical protein
LRFHHRSIKVGPMADRKRTTPRSIPPTPQVGRRPSSPFFLFAVAGMWIIVGVVIWMTFSATWKLVPAVVSIGVGLLFLRGAVTTVNRHEERS